MPIPEHAIRDPVLSVESLVKDYGSLRAVDRVNFEVYPGEVFGLLGPNGAGKTSIISTIVTLEKPSSGRIVILGKDLNLYPRQSKAVTGFVPQETISHGYFNLEEILTFQAGYYGVSGSRSRIQDLIKKLDLFEHRHKNVRQLSGGMKRRLMVAKALLHSPRLLLLDEPTAGVDVELRYAIWDIVRELKKHNVAILFTTHYLEEAEELCDRVAIIHKGKIQNQGPTRSLIQKLTFRHLKISLKKPQTLKHTFLTQARKDLYFDFHLPYGKGVGGVLSDLKLKPEQIEDLTLKEGTLEDAFKRVLKQKKQES